MIAYTGAESIFVGTSIKKAYAIDQILNMYVRTQHVIRCC